MAHTRVGLMKRYLDEHADEIAALPTGVVQFDVGVGPVVSARITRFDRLKRADDYLTPALTGSLPAL